MVYLEDPADFTTGPTLASLYDYDARNLLGEYQRLDEAAGRLRTAAFQQWIAALADELNSSLADYEVRLVHLDTADYLEFVRRPVEAEDAPQR
jgi:hypothetical protein